LKNKRTKLRGSEGFALVITLSLMILLTVVAVGLLSLSAVSLRSTSQSQAKSEAQSNARLALMIALGELQKQLGPDQRVSANSSILADSNVRHPHWTGVWDSWRAGPVDRTNPTPDDLSAHQTIPDARAVPNGMSPTYAANRADHFRSWLLSLNPNEASSISAARDLQLAGTRMPAANATAVQLVAEGSLGTGANAADFVSARLLNVQPGATGGSLRGRYGWWIGDESQKARVTDDSFASPGQSLTTAERIFRQQAPASTGTSTIRGLENLTNDNQLATLPSLSTLNLVSGASGLPAQANFHSITPFSHNVLADVREGGLKRDLSTLLERPIDLGEKGDDFMLYKFSAKDAWMGITADSQECVPIQDLAAYYQLYHGSRADWRQGVQYRSNLLPNAMHVVSPHYGGGAANDPAYFREYSTLYRQPVLLNVQFLLSMFAQPIANAPVPGPSDPDPFTHYLRVGISPAVTFWNPNNIPMTMRFEGEMLSQTMRFGAPPLRISWSKDGTTYSTPMDLSWYSYAGNNDDSGGIFNLYFSGKRSIAFEPGQVRTFSLGYSGDQSGTRGGSGGHVPTYQREFLFKTDKYFEPLEVFPGWEPQSAVLYNRSAQGLPDVADIRPAGNLAWNVLKLRKSDRLFFNIDGKRAGGANSTAFGFYLNQTSHQTYTQYGGDAKWFRQHYQFRSRGGSASFNESVITNGFPQNQPSLITAEARSVQDLISKGEAGWPFMLFSLQAGAETSQEANGFVAAGRKFASRPFLHSPAMTPPFIDDITGTALYDAGWNWSVEPINGIFEVPIMVSADDEGYYGGGNTAENGTTHVVQQEIPVVPPIAIAALSHAHLGGFSLATQGTLGGEDTAPPAGFHYQNVTATGQGGIFPRTIQAIGNSYAHPNLAANKAYDIKQRTFSTTGGTSGAQRITFADHSYLANKALWDEFFFSSISPQPAAVQAFGRSNLTAGQIAKAFFFDQTPLPNRRMVPANKSLTEAELGRLFSSSQANQFKDGLADRIGAYLMVEGAFNVNSTSVEAWKVLLSSLKGKPIAYLDKDKAFSGTALDTQTPAGIPVASSSLPNGKPVKGSSSASNDPDQWTNWRELSEKEIDELATAIIKQVRLRGPFLSLSEFVNRRLDSGNEELSVKGALQAALDDPAVSINEGFRNSARQFSADEINAVRPVFRKAMEGAVAYGSSAYVDQADILRNFAAQLTPRGDTFIIRTYGDAIDSGGNVVARAWCEAVVQRQTEYFDPIDEAHVKHANLRSDANRKFGRKLDIVSFRWLNPSEV
jgi:hypothetical protein